MTKSLDGVPVSCGASAVEHARCRKEQRATAYRRQARSAPIRLLQKLYDLAGIESACDTRASPCGDNRIALPKSRRAEVINRHLRHDAHAGRRSERAALGSQDHKLIGLPAKHLIRTSKRGHGPRDVQHLAVREREHQNAAPFDHGRRLA